MIRVLISFFFLASMTTGCMSARRTRSELPAEWAQALQTPVVEMAAFSGVYSEIGEEATEGPLGRDYLNSSFLHPRFFPELRLSVPEARNKTIEITVVSADRLTVALLEEAEVLATGEFEGSFDQSTGGLTLNTYGSRSVKDYGASVSRNAVQLFKGSDGYLYVRRTSQTIGVILVVPLAGVRETWSRFSSTPESELEPEAEGR